MAAIANLTVDYKIKTVLGVSDRGPFFVFLGWLDLGVSVCKGDLTAVLTILRTIHGNGPNGPVQGRTDAVQGPSPVPF